MDTLVKTARLKRDLTHRSAEREWLDDAGMSASELEPVLRDLARFNGAMLGHRPILAWLGRAVQTVPKDQPLTLVDVGSGYGDLLRAIRHWAAKRSLRLRLIGIDLSQQTVRVAEAATDPCDGIEYHVSDVFSYQPDKPPDFVVSSLLTHHMTDAMIVKFLRWMEDTARRGWFIYDLQRHAVPFHFIGLMRRLTRIHPIVIHDGRISVARSLTREEWLARFADAAIPPDAVQLHWFLFRFAIGRLR